MKNARELREKQIQLYEQLEQKQVPLEDAKVLNNISQTILQSAKAEMHYCKLQETKRRIDFLEDEKGGQP